MSARARRWLRWAPRVLGVVFAVAMCSLALEALWGGLGLARNIGVFFLELIPGAVIALVVALSWRWPWVGGAAFTLLGILYLAGNTGLLPSPVYFVVGGVLLLLGVLFALNWRYRHELAA